MLLRITSVALLGLVLVGCDLPGTKLEKAQRVDPAGTTFNRNLYQGYIDLASSEYNEGDYTDSDTFAVRAMQSGTGGTVAPEEISARRLPEDKVGELTSARQRLVGTLSKGAAEKVPSEAALAQTGFDCWMQEQEENFQPDDIETCRSQFFAALDYIEDAMKPKPIAKKVEPAPPPPPMKPETFLVFFAFDSDKLIAVSETVLDNVMTAAKKMGAKDLAITGHADRAGPEEYNLGLSLRRASAVLDALAARGGDPAAISLAGRGEAESAVATADGVPEPANRRVEIIVLP